MGTFAGSVHVRGSDSRRLRGVLTKVARKLECRFFLAPKVDGWLTAFPSGSGQDLRVSMEIAQLLPSAHVLPSDAA